MRPHGCEGLPEAPVHRMVVQLVKDLGGAHPMHLLINLLHRLDVLLFALRETNHGLASWQVGLLLGVGVLQMRGT